MNRTSYKVIIFLGTLIFPIYTLPWIIKSMLKNKKFGYFLFALTMGYLAYLMVPYDTFDLTRHYESFNRLKDVDFSDILIVAPRILDYTFNIYSWFVSHIGLSKEFLPFSVAFTIFMLYFLSIRKIILYSQTYNYDKVSYYFLSFIGIFFIFNEIRFIGGVSGLRNDLAFAIFVYALIEFYTSKRILRVIIYSIFASAIHISVLPLFLIFLLSKLIDFNKFLYFLFIASFLLTLSGYTGKIFYMIIHVLEPFLRANGLYFHAYMDPNGVWGSGFYEHVNMKTMILEKVIKPLPFYLVGIYLLIVKRLTWSKTESFLYMTFAFIALVSISRTMLDRYSYFFVLFFIYVLLVDIATKPKSNFKRLFLIIFSVSLLLMDIAGMVKYRDIFTKSWTKMLYVPAPVMLMKHVEPKDYIHRESL